jgi:tetratricopeptide (TPR) repeat protein
MTFNPLRKNQSFCFFSLFLLAVLSYGQSPPPLYYSLVQKAEAAAKSGDYKRAALMYSSALATNRNIGFSDDRYNAARACALAGANDSAIILLQRSVNWKMICDEERLTAQKDFEGLTEDLRWKAILDTLHFCKQPMKSAGQFPEGAYCRYIKSADSLFKNKEYAKAGKVYATAFRVCSNRGWADDRYNAARAWALAGMKDSAFECLERIVKKRFLTDEARLREQKDLSGLQADPRWNELFELIADRKTQMEIPFKWHRAGDKPKSYAMGIDKGSDARGGNAVALKSIEDKIKGFGTLMSSLKADSYIGRKIRLTGYLKSEDVLDWAGFWMRVDGKEKGKSLAFDNMQDRAIKGSTNWTKYEILLDVPENATYIAFGALLSGTGKIWVDDIKLELVEKKKPKIPSYVFLPVIYDFED